MALPCNDLAQFRGHLGDLETGNKSRQLVRVGAQVVEHAGVTQQARIHPPGSLCMALLFQ